MRRLSRATLSAVALIAIVGAGACANEAPAPGPTTSGSSGPGATTTSPVTPSPTATGTVSAWTSGPLNVPKTVPVPPVPRLTGIRTAAHSAEGYDRITFDFVGTLPGYSVRYVSTVVADGSGQPVNVPGRQHLQIVFKPAQAHDDSGNPVTPRSATLTYPMMRAYAITGDFEGVLTVTIGLDDVVGYRVGELPGQPGRIYLDVAA